MGGERFFQIILDNNKILSTDPNSYLDIPIISCYQCLYIFFCPGSEVIKIFYTQLSMKFILSRDLTIAPLQVFSCCKKAKF